MDRVGATNPFHISKAYGLPRPNATGAASASAGASSGASFQGSISKIGSTSAATRTGSSRTDVVDASTARVAAAKQKIGNLVAARVSEQPESSAATLARAATTPRAASTPTGGSFPMYRHPADKNAAATAVNAGRVLDLNA